MHHILVVDDEQNNLQAIQRIFLDEARYKIKLVNNGYEALQLIEIFIPDVILLDIMMPGMNGYEVCDKIKSDSKTSGIMVMLLSGKADLNDRLRGYSVCADDYLTKPYEPEELKAKIRILLRLKNAQDELQETNQTLERIVEHRTRELIAKERQAVVGRMVHGIVHNLQNPLMAASGFANLADENMKHLHPLLTRWPPEQRQAVEYIGEDIKKVLASLARIQELVDNLLQKGKKEAADKYQKLNFNELLAAEVKFLEADPDFKHSVLKELKLDPHLPEFIGNYADFSQIISNMIKNAVDAMQQAPTKKITISTGHDIKNISICFKDTGQGIPSRIIDHIFEPFFSTKAQKGEEKGDEPTGTGLGLYSCQQLLKAYNGTIKVSSELQVGTTFTISLPYGERHESVQDGPCMG